MIEGQGRTCKGGEERINNSTDVVHGEDNTGSWIWGLIGANRSKLEHMYGCTLTEVGTICKAVGVCLHTADTSLEEQGCCALGSTRR